MVAKRHNFPLEEPKQLWVFTTLKSTDQSTNHVAALNNASFNVKFVADVAKVEMSGHYFAWQYQHIFNLTDIEMEEAVVFLRYWNILRLCCGMQMSADWRDFLSHPVNYTSTPHHHANNTSGDPACEMYNIDQVASRLLATNLAGIIKPHKNLAPFLLRPSQVDGELNETYCSDYNKQIAQYHVGFNHFVVNGTIHGLAASQKVVNMSSVTKRMNSDPIKWK